MFEYKFYALESKKATCTDPKWVKSDVLPRIGETVKYSGGDEYRITRVIHVMGKCEGGLESRAHVEGVKIK